MCVYVCVRYHQKMFATKVRMQNLLEGLAVSEVEVNCKNGGNCREKCCYGPGLNLNTFHIDYSNSLATGPRFHLCSLPPDFNTVAQVILKLTYLKNLPMSGNVLTRPSVISSLVSLPHCFLLAHIAPPRLVCVSSDMTDRLILRTFGLDVLSAFLFPVFFKLWLIATFSNVTQCLDQLTI